MVDCSLALALTAGLLFGSAFLWTVRRGQATGMNERTNDEAIATRATETYPLADAESIESIFLLTVFADLIPALILQYLLRDAKAFAP